MVEEKNFETQKLVIEEANPLLNYRELFFLLFEASITKKATKGLIINSRNFYDTYCV